MSIVPATEVEATTPLSPSMVPEVALTVTLPEPEVALKPVPLLVVMVSAEVTETAPTPVVDAAMPPVVPLIVPPLTSTVTAPPTLPAVTPTPPLPVTLAPRKTPIAPEPALVATTPLVAPTTVAA